MDLVHLLERIGEDSYGFLFVKAAKSGDGILKDFNKAPNIIGLADLMCRTILMVIFNNPNPNPSHLSVIHLSV